MVLSFGPFLHVVLDETYLEPRAFLCPFYGFAFEKTDVDDFAGKMLHEIHTDVALCVAGMIGAAILAWFVLLLVRRSEVLALARIGQASL
jgi:hypothetical protein